MVKSVTRVLHALAGLSLVLAACGAPVAAPSQPPATPSAAPSTDPSASVEATPSAAPEQVPGVRVPDPTVTLDGRAFPIESTLVLERPVIDEEAREKVRQGILAYLMRLDWHRNGPGEGGSITITGRFAEAVKQGLDSSRTPGIERSFVLESFEVDRYLVKPWGTPAVAEARVTIVDRAKDGKAPDQRETGRLRMLGDRLSVIDGWDEVNDRWFNNDLEVMTTTKLRELVLPTLRHYLRFETWIPGSPLETGFGPGTNPFWDARHKYLATFDRGKIVSRTFADVTARVERFETFPELSHGLATASLSGTVISIDASGREGREGFERKVLILVGNWIPEVVDQEVSPGVWVSDGTLMATLRERDQNFA
jgi:hypothetical protein